MVQTLLTYMCMEKHNKRRRYVLHLLLFASLLSSTSKANLLPLQKYGVAVASPHLASKYDIETVSRDLDISSCSLLLTENQSDGALELEWSKASNVKQLPFRIDFSSGASSRRQKSAKSELVCKAIGNAQVVVDLTAGLGRDSFVLASSGYSVHMVERNPVLHLLLKDAISRLSLVDSIVAGRMTLYSKDSRCLQSADDLFEGHKLDESSSQSSVAVYLDPMYQPNTVGKKSSVKKETQILHHLVDPIEGSQEENNKSLLETAMRLSTTRIVVKRPLKSPPLANAKPHSCVEGSTQRFDLYFMNQKINFL